MIKEYIKKNIRRGSVLWNIIYIPYAWYRAISKVLMEKPRALARKVFKNSIFYREAELNMCSLFPQKILDYVYDTYHPKSVLDLGCGVGRASDYFLSRGASIFGVDGSRVAIRHARHPELIKKYNLNQELNLRRKFDLVWSFEFIEHIHPDYLHNLMKTISNHSDIVILSAARPGQGGEGHFNEQHDEYWIEIFGRYGYSLNKEKTADLRSIDEKFSGNMYAFERAAQKFSPAS